MKKILYLLLTVLVFLSITPKSFAAESTYETLKIFSDVIDEIQKNYVDDVDTNELIIKAIKGMVRDLDPHSVYLLPEAHKALTDDTKGEFSGIGVVMTTKNNKLTIIAPIKDTPAFKAGIKPGDIIVKINGLSTSEMPVSEAISKIKGPSGSDLKLTILRSDEDKLIPIKIKREEIPLRSVKYTNLKPGYPYISISNFNERTASDLKKSLEHAAKDGNIKGLVLDLRNNPGGLLNQAVLVSDFFIKKGIIVSIKGRNKAREKIWNANPDTPKITWPMVVLINGGSASAAEIVAGALKDHQRALILGTTSFGKGSVQNITPLNDESALKLTVARYYTPSGKSIQAIGITPDIILEYAYIEKIAEHENFYKEKDLKNHLAAEKKKTKKKTHINTLNEILKNNLQSDNQVQRALELLVSHNIFSKEFDN